MFASPNVQTSISRIFTKFEVSSAVYVSARQINNIHNTVAGLADKVVLDC